MYIIMILLSRFFFFFFFVFVHSLTLPFLYCIIFFNINGKKHRKQNLETSVGLAFNIKMLSLDKIEGIEARWSKKDRERRKED